MIQGLTSIVIPTYNHAQYLHRAIDSALEQTVPVEVIVVDDGSTDGTHEEVERYQERVRYYVLDHEGVAAARNAGIDAALGEFVMFLDADDVIDPRKVELQLPAMDEFTGWVLCDVLINDDVKGTQQNASEAYGYAGRQMSGWLRPQLSVANFIPVMSPLVRRSAIGSLRFMDQDLEDWAFWYALARDARAAYVPEVLATYQHRKEGRSRERTRPRASAIPSVELPLRLNLGCGTPGTRSWHPMSGLVNLDKSLGWTFEDGLGDYADHSVAGITVSHALMYVAEARWPFVFSEFARVLADGGVVRITEDDAVSEASSRRGGWKGSQPAVAMTSHARVAEMLERFGLAAVVVTPTTSRYMDESLLQAQHGEPPDVFFTEGVRRRSVLFSPHNDDEALFAAFTIQRYRPDVVVCHGSASDYGDSSAREAESRAACKILGAKSLTQWVGGDLVAQMIAYDEAHHPEVVFAPDPRTSHPDHLATAEAADRVFGDRVRTFHTYAAVGKVRLGAPVAFEPEWLEHKLRALAEYRTQIAHPRARAFFTWDPLEYAG